MSAAVPARAAWIEVGPSSSATPEPRRVPPAPPVYPPPPPPIVPDGPSRAIRSFLEAAYLGSAYGWGGLTIVPVLVSGGTATTSLRSLDSALRSGTLIVREYGSGSVPTVEVENRGSTPVFLLAGEIILGGKQDRVIREDTVLAPRSGPVQVPVYCVEQGRWAASPRAFDSAPHAIADLELRSKASAGAGQDEVWSHVKRESEARGVRSPTASYGDLTASPELARRLDEYVSRCPRPSPWRGRAVGAVFLSGGEVLGVDLFGDPGLLSSLWPKLVRSYAARAMHGRRDLSGTAGASAVLESLRAAWPSFSGWAGAGSRYTLGVSGFDVSAVTWSDAVVHVAALPGVVTYVPPYTPPYDPPYPWYRDPYEE